MITSVTKMWSRDGSSVTSPTANPSKTDFQFVTAYQVLTDTAEDYNHKTILVAAAEGLPQIGDKFPDSTVDAFVIGQSATRVSPIFWIVQIQYQGTPNEDSGTEIEWSDTSTTEPIDQDWNGRAIVNVNGEPVEGLSMDLADPVLILRRRFYSINVYGIHAYRHSTNSDTFFGWPAGTARLVGYSAKSKFQNGTQQEWWDVTARIQFRWPYQVTPDKAWYKRYRNEGFYVTTYETTGVGILRKKRAVDFFKVDTTKPVLLNASGEVETDPDAAVWLHAQVYGSLPYSLLGF